MKLDFKQISLLLDEMESILQNVQKISREFDEALDAKKKELKKAA